MTLRPLAQTRSALVLSLVTIASLGANAGASQILLYASVTDPAEPSRAGLAVTPLPITTPTFLGPGVSDGSILTDGDADSADQLWIPSFRNGLYRFDLSTNTYTLVGPWGLPSTFTMNSIAFSPAGELLGIGRLSSNYALYTINPASGEATFRSSIFATAFGIDFGPDGKLYATVNGGIAEINPYTGQFVRTVALTPTGWGALDYGPDGLLRVLRPAATVFEVNPVDGTLAEAGLLTGFSAFGLATIPSPAPAVCFGLGFAVFANRRRAPRR